MNKEEIDLYIKKHRINIEKGSDFVSYLYTLMEEKGIQNASELYQKAGISKQSYSAIISGKCSPSLITCLKLVFALKLDNHECKYLLKKAGFTLSSSNPYSLIIRYCIEHQIYDVDEVNEILTAYGYSDSLIY